MAQLTRKQKEFLGNPYVASLTTLRADGSPHTTFVWMDVDGDDIRFNTARGRAKARHLERDSRVSIAVVDPADQYRWVAVSGTAELTEEGADAHIDALAKKYLGADSYPWRDPAETRVTVRIEAEHVGSTGLDG